MIMLILSLLFNAPAIAAPSQVELAQKTWTEFKKCNEARGETAIDKCLNATLAPDLDPLPRQKMTEYILMGFKFSDLHICDERDTVVPVKTKAMPIYYCLSVLGHRSRTQGYATFEKHKDGLRLTSVRYDF